MSATPSLKLIYFDLDGRASVIRKTLTLGGVPFIDERIPRDLSPLKSKLPYGKVPILEVDDQIVAETMAILRYVSKLAGMYPPSNEPLAAAMVDEIIDSFDDLFEGLMAPSFEESDKTKKKELREAMLAGPLPQAFELLDTRLAQIQEYSFFKTNSTKIYLQEILAWDYVEFMRSGIIDHVPTAFIDKYKTIVSMHKRVEGQQRVDQRPSIASELPHAPRMLTLTYFDAPGRAESIRLALQIGGIPFDDERISFDEVVKRKSEFPNAQVPVLKIHDTICLAQSIAILRYVGKFTGLYPVHDDLQALKIDEVLSHIGELFFAVNPLFNEKNPVKKEVLREQLVTTTIPASLNSLDKRLEHFKTDTKTPYAMGGESLTIADLGIYSLVMFIQSGFENDLPTHLLASSEAVKQHPRVQAWYKTDV